MGHSGDRHPTERPLCHPSKLAPSPNIPYTEFKVTGGDVAGCKLNMTISGRALGVPSHALYG